MTAKQSQLYCQVAIQLTLVATVLYYLLYLLTDRDHATLLLVHTPGIALLKLCTALLECFVFVSLSFLYNKLLLKPPILQKRTFPQLLWHNLLLLLLNLCTAYLFSLLIMLAGQEEQQFFNQNLYVFSIIVSFLSGIYTNYWLLLEVKETNLRRMEAEIGLLKAQISPHFMFNNFSILSELIEENPREATRFLGQFSKVYRYVIDNARRDLVPLAEEVAFLTSYVYLLKIRYEDGVQIGIEPGLHKAAGNLPPVSLQLAVENAIKHNERPLHIQIRQDGDNVVVENDYRPLKCPPPSAGKGKEFISVRYSLLTERKPAHDQKDGKYIVMLPIINTSIAR